jgi:hypothetical protein
VVGEVQGIPVHGLRLLPVRTESMERSNLEAQTVLEEMGIEQVEVEVFLLLEGDRIIQQGNHFKLVYMVELNLTMAEMADLVEAVLQCMRVTKMAGEAAATPAAEVLVQVAKAVQAAAAVPIILELVKKIFPGLAVAMDSSVFIVPRG